MDGERHPGLQHRGAGSGTNPFIMQPEGLGRLFAIDKMAEGPFPEHYEPMETPLGTNPLHPNVISNPAARLYEADKLRMGTKQDFPYVGTTYRLTEHFHTGPSTHCLMRLLNQNSLWKSAKRWRQRKVSITAIA